MTEAKSMIKQYPLDDLQIMLRAMININQCLKKKTSVLTIILKQS